MMAGIERFYSADGSLNVRLLGRLISGIENNPQFAEELLAEVYRENDGALVLGITGPPGVGKSSLTDGLVGIYREEGKQVAVIAVDPSSPFSGGAILGDRIRMSSHATDSGVFIRSMGSRGFLGGLAPATVDVMNLLTSIGFDVVIIETVGVGQGEIDIMHLVDTVLLVLVPGMGDDIQALKAGIMEIADVFIINKADKPGVEKLLAEINMLLMLNQGKTEWVAPVVEMVATEHRGFECLLEEIGRHREYVAANHEKVRRLKLENRFRQMVGEKVSTLVFAALENNDRVNGWVQDVAAGKVNPYAAVREFDKCLKITWEG